MGKEKFVYNIHTLTYEKVVITIKTRVVQAFGLFSGALVLAVVLLGLFYRYFPSPREKELIRENEQLEYKFSNIDEQLVKMSKALTNVQERDATVHRAVFGMNPINENIWNGGIGGHDLTNEKNLFPNSWETVSQTESRVDVLTRQLSIQAKSLDTLLSLAKEKEKMLASIPSIKPVRQDQLQKSMDVLSGFGWRIHPIYKIAKMHEGVDFPARIGTAIQSSGDGVVVTAGVHHGYGNCVEIDHGFGYVTRYAHMSKMSVRAGQKVKKGQQIGAVGDTGLSTAPHLHYEVHYRGKPINPINFCYDGLTTTEYKALCGSAIRSNQSLD